jgi:hypothetical protein
MAPESILLIVHIAAGFTALIAAAAATLSKVLDVAHRWHVYSGRVFFWGMAVVFVTALPLAILRPNTFLFLIAFLSFYFAVAGMRYATNRRGTPRPLDWGSAGVMVLSGGIMVGFGAFLLARGDTNGITMIVLGAVGGVLSIADLRTLRRGGARGPERIAQHLTMMLGGTIATVTAFVVTNVDVQPEFIVWLAPTVVIAPLIFVWSRKVRGGRKVRGMPGPP